MRCSYSLSSGTCPSKLGSSGLLAMDPVLLNPHRYCLQARHRLRLEGVSESTWVPIQSGPHEHCLTWPPDISRQTVDRSVLQHYTGPCGACQQQVGPGVHDIEMGDLP